MVWAHVHVGKNNDLNVDSFYCRPHSNVYSTWWLAILPRCHQAKIPHIQIVLGGDFNCPCIECEHGTLTDSCTYIMSLPWQTHCSITRQSDVSVSHLFYQSPKYFKLVSHHLSRLCCHVGHSQPWVTMMQFQYHVTNLISTSNKKVSVALHKNMKTIK